MATNAPRTNYSGSVFATLGGLFSGTLGWLSAFFLGWIFLIVLVNYWYVLLPVLAATAIFYLFW